MFIWYINAEWNWLDTPEFSIVIFFIAARVIDEENAWLSTSARTFSSDSSSRPGRLRAFNWSKNAFDCGSRFVSGIIDSLDKIRTRSTNHFFPFFIFGAVGRTRTDTEFPPQASETCVSTNSTTTACYYSAISMPARKWACKWNTRCPALWRCYEKFEISRIFGKLLRITSFLSQGNN